MNYGLDYFMTGRLHVERVSASVTASNTKISENVCYKVRQTLLWDFSCGCLTREVQYRMMI